MRLPPSVRYLPSRLTFASNPWLWLGLLLTGIVGLAAWEYRQNPGQLPWQVSSKSSRPAADVTSSAVTRESLSADEEAIAAELDNVELLLAQLDSDVTALTTGGEESAAASLNATADNVDGSSNESNVDRLNRYVDEYRFPGTGARDADVQAIIPVQKPRDSVLTFQQTPDNGQTVSVLEDALARLELTSRSDNPTVSSETTAESAPSGAAADATDDTNDAAASAPTTFSFGQLDQSEVVPGSLDGLNQSFIRTTPNMSPPPGTTGYVPPASLSDFNRLNQPSADSPFGTQPSPGAFGNTAPALPGGTQVLPPTVRNNPATLETPAFDNSSQNNQNQPRNAWENFWD